MFNDYTDILLLPLAMLLAIYWSLLLCFYCERCYLKRIERSTENERRLAQGSSLCTIPHRPTTSVSSFENHRVQNSEPTTTSGHPTNIDSISPVLNVERDRLSSYGPFDNYYSFI